MSIFDTAHIVQAIEIFFLEMFKKLSMGDLPVIEYDLLGEAWTDFRLDEEGRLELKPDGVRRKRISLGRRESIRRFVSIVRLMGQIKRLLVEDTYANMRDLYYQNVLLYGSQEAVNSAIKTITLILKVPRRSLNITASGKGLIAGHLLFLDEAGVQVDCLHTISGIPVPPAVEEIEILHSSAKFILVVEKDTVFQQLREDDICWIEGYPCIMITGKGYPDEATRYFLMKLVEVLQIPVYSVTDADPHGIEIMCMYRYGTKAPHFGNLSLVVPEIRWLGVMPSDVSKYIEYLPEEALVALTDKDRNLALDILHRPYCTDSMRIELEIMLELNCKLEIENISAIEPRFFVDEYLRGKLDQPWEWI
ncbi:Meiotic recombination protein SPO11 [Hypsibius exemplaris]|uniref:DNA topoisomerase (ATP-hydrolyzing) n=1 Tax=Hypsibius exemplaris TaxID=2072580 RepID=A0A1W0WLY4_HYPEX|nr:Meiotic recombination protein SPO11 [Hypsibius exemplaris]